MLSHIWGIFSFSSSSIFSVPPPSNPSLEAQIPVSRPKSHFRGPNSYHEGFGPQGWDLGLETRIWASRLEGVGTEEGEKSIRHMCESIGHRPLRGRCPASPSTSSTSYLCQVDTVQFYWLLNLNMSYHRIRRKMNVHSEDNWRSLFHFCI